MITVNEWLIIGASLVIVAGLAAIVWSIFDTRRRHVADFSNRRQKVEND